MTSALDPIATSESVVDTYTRYLGSLLPLRDESLRSAIDRALRDTEAISRGPLLEMTPPFRAGRSLRQLVDAGILAPTFGRLFSEGLPGDRPLYAHQDAAICKAVADRNVVVATGTGSGKTESFLVPVFDHLVREIEAGVLGPGVRALVLYPMNALANDQLKRLRGLLADTPEITFGRYTGDTRQSERDARDAYVRQYGEEPLPNELVSRDAMQKTPPHILLTNYAMLEYLLLRPRDLALFEGEFQGTWKFVVVDEAHVYDGIKGAEIAMLLRRLRDRVGRGTELRCLASSATVGADWSRVARFGRSLFGTRFEWVDGDPTRQDVVVADRHPVPDSPTWGPLDPEALNRLAAAEDPQEWLVARGLGRLEDEASMRLVLRRLAEGPQSLDVLARAVFPDEERRDARRALVTLVDAAHRVPRREGAPVLSARYHLFVSAVEGAYACFSETGPHVRFSRHVVCPECESPMFELAACKRCGEIHLPGTVTRHDGAEVFEPRKSRTNDGRHWLVIGEEANGADEDDDAHEGTDQDDSPHHATLCTGCGTLGGKDDLTCRRCSVATTLRRVIRLDARGELNRCVACGGRAPRQVRRFSSGADATAAVIASSVYEHLPTNAENFSPGEGRQLLMFSDSRQQAAFAAPYLEHSYGSLLQRRVLMLALAKERDEELAGSDVVAVARKQAEHAGLFEERATAFAKRQAVATWLQREMIEGDERTSLEGTGLARVRLVRPRMAAPTPLRRLGLSDDEAWDLLDVLAQTLRIQGAVAPADDNVDLADPMLAPRNRAVYVRERQSESKASVLAWLPSTGARSNRRLDYLGRVLAALGSSEDPTTLLAGIWKFLTSPAGPRWLTSVNDPRRGPVWRIDADALRWQCVRPGDAAWRCSVCRRRTSVSVHGVCPTNWCAGILEPTGAEPDPRDHYARLYTSMPAHSLNASEHTAQLTSDTATEVQEKFRVGDINVLSCSTTFELGVDVGELQCVLLRNVPPTTANYVQRAGRAGRRTESAALVVTFAQMRSHDQSMFLRPEEIIRGEVRAPIVVEENVRVDRRHAHSIALAAFFRERAVNYGQVFSSVSDFYDSDGSASGEDLLREFLRSSPPGVLDALQRVLPAPVQVDVGVEDGTWAEQLILIVAEAGELYRADVTYFEERLTADVEASNFRGADAVKRVLQTLRRQQLLSYFARKNVLPKYGFPVDTVELKVSGDVDARASMLDLSRDLTVAINEYAPGGAIVAMGKIIESAGIYRLPKRDLVSRYYAVCGACQHVEVSNGVPGPACPACDTPRTGTPRQFVKPEFGFVASRDIKPVTMSRPRSSWSSRMSVLDRGEVTESGKAPTDVGTATWQLCVRATMLVLNEGPGHARFAICDWCGYAAQGFALSGTRKRKPHTRPLNGRPCDGPLQLRALGHDFQTDALFLDLPRIVSIEQARSVLYGLLAGAADALEVTRDDLDGSVLLPDHTLVLFDTVPGGAGLVRRIAENFEGVVSGMRRRVESCECGPETSCNRCLRVYRNQVFHDELRRNHVLALL
ncbi:DEAD/DEAH box helicase [Isoptericola sp. NPDC019571]|uniref:DEAD/DEAH box helicase n=1 Tax=Isoptericola sp. NPDC019571 TaxID=3364008 RepID=UPI003797111F